MEPDFASVVRDEFGKWYLPDLVEHLIDGLRKAGLDVPAATAASSRQRACEQGGVGEADARPRPSRSPCCRSPT